MIPTTPARDAPPDGAEGSRQPTPTRREFLKQSACAVGAGVITLVICDKSARTEAAPPSTQPSSAPSHRYDWRDYSYVYLIDVRKCIGCGSCVRACTRENAVPPGRFRTWVERYRVSRQGEPQVDSPDGGMDGFQPLVSSQEIVKAYFFPKLCCHCTHTPCVQLCPVGASYRTLDGVVLVDEQRCIGCGYCVQACPYGSRFIHPVKHVASKCTLCYHRLTRGLEPACVQACPVGARMLGNTKKVGDMVAEIIATQEVHILQPELLTQPNCYYLGLSHGAR